MGNSMLYVTWRFECNNISQLINLSLREIDYVAVEKATPVVNRNFLFPSTAIRN